MLGMKMRQQTPAGKHAVKQAGFEGCDGMVLAAFGSWSLTVTPGLGHAPSCVQLACQTVQGVSFISGEIEEKLSGTEVGKDEISYTRQDPEFLSALLNFCIIAIVNEKSPTGWTKSTYFGDKILGPDSQSRQMLAPGVNLLILLHYHPREREHHETK